MGSRGRYMFETGIIYKIIGIAIASILMIFLGRADKRQRLSTGNKLIFQILISLIVIYSGVKIEFLRDPSSTGEYLYLNFFSIPLTLIWIVSITNSIGQVDEFGDITPYIVFIASLTFLVVSFLQRQGLILAEILSLILAAVSFLFIKYIPKEKLSSYYMSFGFVLAIIAIVGVSKSTAALTLFIPLLILGVPIIDSSYSIVAAYARSENIGDHSSFPESRLRQKLQSYGFSPQGANIIIISSSLYLSLSALIISVYQNIYLLMALLAGGSLVFELIKKQVQSGEIIIGEDSSANRVKLFQIGIDRIDNQSVINKIEEFISSQRTHPYLIVTPDTLAILRARKDSEYYEILKSADLVTPDGAGILWAALTLRQPLIERVTGIDIINKVCQLAVQKGYSLYLLGSYPGIAKEAALNLTRCYPGLKIVGSHHGYFDSRVKENIATNKEEAEIIREINEKRPDILLVGMGVPKQEKWIANNLEKLNVSVCMGVGGSFDVLSGRIPRAPLWMQRHGMEWVYRLIKQPKRIFRVLALFYFIWLVIVGKIIITLKNN
ncbi:MAG TPA: hypothetical protein DEG96_02215 [Candidatus Atribacteria bacterium]|nr:hypothetical protein [Candidatus Atribacteria bacterium]